MAVLLSAFFFVGLLVVGLVGFGFGVGHGRATRGPRVGTTPSMAPEPEAETPAPGPVERRDTGYYVSIDGILVPVDESMMAGLQARLAFRGDARGDA